MGLRAKLDSLWGPGCMGLWLAAVVEASLGASAGAKRVFVIGGGNQLLSRMVVLPC